MRDDASAYRAAGAGTVVGHHLLAQQLAHLGGNHPSHGVYGRAGRLRDDETHRPGRVVVRGFACDGERVARENSSGREGGGRRERLLIRETLHDYSSDLWLFSLNLFFNLQGASLITAL